MAFDHQHTLLPTQLLVQLRLLFDHHRGLQDTRACVVGIMEDGTDNCKEIAAMGKKTDVVDDGVLAGQEPW